MKITSEVICDSIGEHSPRLVTMLCSYPKFVHAEHLRHRAFSFSVSSSRAIPVARNLEIVRSDELRAAPVWWGKEQKGMQSGEELDNSTKSLEWTSNELGETNSWKTPYEGAKRIWEMAARDAVHHAKWVQKIGAHKSIVNRILEPFLPVNVLVTGTHDGWMNFFGLRLDRAAQPEIRALAEEQWRCWNESRPRTLKPGLWHLPFTDHEMLENLQQAIESDHSSPLYPKETLIKISVARCARLSYRSFATGARSTIEEDLALYDRLVGSTPIHASPAEHQATPDHLIPAFKVGERIIEGPLWSYPQHQGNLGPGWRQYRKMLAGEAIAQLPEQYR